MQVKDGIGDFPFSIRFDDSRDEGDIPGARSGVVTHDGVRVARCFTETVVPKKPHLIRVVSPRSENHLASEIGRERAKKGKKGSSEENFKVVYGVILSKQSQGRGVWSRLSNVDRRDIYMQTG